MKTSTALSIMMEVKAAGVVKTGASRQPRAGWGMAPPLRSTALEGELPFTLELTAED